MKGAREMYHPPLKTNKSIKNNTFGRIGCSCRLTCQQDDGEEHDDSCEDQTSNTQSIVVYKFTQNNVTTPSLTPMATILCPPFLSHFTPSQSLSFAFPSHIFNLCPSGSVSLLAPFTPPILFSLSLSLTLLAHLTSTCACRSSLCLVHAFHILTTFFRALAEVKYLKYFARADTLSKLQLLTVYKVCIKIYVCTWGWTENIVKSFCTFRHCHNE